MKGIKEMLKEKAPLKVFEEARDVARGYVEELRKQGRISFSKPNSTSRPSIRVVRCTIPEVWEDTTMALMAVGREISPHCDPKSKDGEYEGFPSLKATVMMRIEEPFGEPQFHKHYLGGWMGFGDYKAEIEGVKDGWMISPADVAEKMR